MNILALLGLLASFSFSVIEAAGKGPQYPFITHVLDASKGKPGSGMKVQFFRKEAGAWRLFQDALTNFDGRIGNLIPKEKFLSGMKPNLHISLWTAGKWCRPPPPPLK